MRQQFLSSLIEHIRALTYSLNQLILTCTNAPQVIALGASRPKSQIPARKEGGRKTRHIISIARLGFQASNGRICTTGSE